MPENSNSKTSPLMSALEQFEHAEGNLLKMERIASEIDDLGASLGENPEFEELERSYSALRVALPTIDGWKPTAIHYHPSDRAQSQMDAWEIGELACEIDLDRAVAEPSRELREYRSRLNTKRRALIRTALIEFMDLIDGDLQLLRSKMGSEDNPKRLDKSEWQDLRDHVYQIEVLLGSSVRKPPRWDDLRRHIAFAFPKDLRDIEVVDWPAAKQALRKGLYGANEAIPVAVSDLADLVSAQPRGPVSTSLAWPNIDDDDFERLIFNLINDESGYENPAWLTRTRAPDRGRDLSVTRVVADPLIGTQRLRVIIQCKHWLSKSVSATDAANAVAQMALWTPPVVEELIIATSGRFTTDAVDWIERHNAKGASPRVIMWPESHLEHLLARRPGLIAESGLR